MRKLLALALAALVAAAVSPTLALGDGDPASDILLAAPVFLPQDARIPPEQQAQLLALAKEARRAGIPVRIAIVASKPDLGSIPELFGNPQQYARFLGAELSFVYRGRLLVVMPAGLGVHYGKHPVAAELAALRGISPAPGGAGLAAAALTATQRLAAAAGHPLALPRVSASSTITGQARGHGGLGPVGWAVLIGGLGLIAAAALVSLRLRPLGVARPAGSSRRRRG